MQMMTAVNRWIDKVWRCFLPNSPRFLPFRWALDSPVNGVPLESSEKGWLVQGWVLLDRVAENSAAEVELIVDWDPHIELVNHLDMPRTDVVKKLLESESKQSDRLHCGFRFHVPLSVRHFRLWVAYGTKRWLLTTIDIRSDFLATQQPMQVLRGKGTWLFLDNDTNFSVDQHVGRLRMSDAGLKSWSDYLCVFSKLGEERQIPCRLLIAPAKERILSQLYPFPLSDVCVMAQVMALPEATVIVDPSPALESLGEAAFYPTDTHWTHRGAMVASISLAEALGFNPSEISEVFREDRYKSNMVTGDLGGKFTPPQKASADVLVSFQYVKMCIYDNGLPNFGRLVVMENEAAFCEGTCLLFGSSSSYSLFYYLSRVFARLVFVHSAGNVDQEFLVAVCPDYLVAQTNARFMVRVPGVNFNLTNSIREKTKELTGDDFNIVLKRTVSADIETLKRVGISRWASDWAVCSNVKH